ncbi:MAG: hypothetical protein LBT85_02070, partial [Bifidobacteriaceae bacterium]|nr:hypothetical protein [Bifidobacteriaceae bacterium]
MSKFFNFINKNKFILFLYTCFLGLAICIATLKFQCSPFWANSSHSDVWVYSVTGNSWAHGIIPYKDIFEVKGPAFYFLWLVFSWINPWSMTAPYIALIVIYFLTCIVSFLLSKIWLSEKLSFMSTVIFLSALYFFDSINEGNTASWTVEEISVLPILYFIYLVCRELKFAEIEDKSVKAKYWIVNGLGFSFIAWSKYQILGSYLGVFIAILILCVLKKITWQRFRKVVLLNIASFIVISGLIIAYFISVNGLNALVNCYFFNKTDRINSNVFPSEIYNAFEFIYRAFITSSPLYFAFTVVFILSLSVNKFANNMYKDLKLIIILGFAFTIICESLFIRWGQNRIIMFCFIIFGVIWLLKCLSNYAKMIIKTPFIVIICLAIFCQFSISFLHNITHYRTAFYKSSPMTQINNSFVP